MTKYNPELHNKIKKLHKENQQMRDKAILVISVAMFPILFNIYNKIEFSNITISIMYAFCFIILSTIIVFHLLGYGNTIRGCDYQDQLLEEFLKKTNKNQDKIKELENNTHKYYSRGSRYDKFSRFFFIIFFILSTIMITTNIYHTHCTHNPIGNNIMANEEVQNSLEPTTAERTTPIEKQRDEE